MIMKSTNHTTQVSFPDSKVHGVNFGPTWGLKDPGVPHVGPMNLVIWELPTHAYIGLYREKFYLSRHRHCFYDTHKSNTSYVRNYIISM